MRLLLVGAFPYPLAQGSQVYFQEQAHALRDAGAHVELLTYASGDRSSAAAERALAGFVHHTPAAWSAPRKLRSGPSLAKPLADAALASELRRNLVSRGPGEAFDAVLTHNIEAGLAALWSLRGQLTAHIFCVHTLMGHELSAYARVLKSGGPSQSGGSVRKELRRGLDRVGRGLDAAVARRADGWIALTAEASRVMRIYSNRPGALIPPPIPDPHVDSETYHAQTAEIDGRFGLESRRFFLYSGNLDGYQEIDVLAEAAALLARATAGSAEAPRIVIASHDPKAPEQIAQRPGLETRHIESASQMLMLMRHARACILMRKAEGGYPIKLVNAHAVGTPSIAFRGREWGLVDGQNALLANLDRPAVSLADAILRLWQDDDLAQRLGRGARALYLERHQPSRAARETLELVEQTLAAKRSARGR